MPWKSLALACVVCFSLAWCWAQAEAPLPEGGISGTILTEDGQLASGASPCVSVRSGSSTSVLCRGNADKEGRFTIQHLKPGNYHVFAFDEAEGYSEQNQSPGQDVTISSDQPWANVTIRMRGRGGILVGSITDKMTGKKIQGAIIEFIQIDKKASGSSAFSGGGDFHVAIPANSDVVLLAMADGYKGWVYVDAANPSRPVLRVSSGERKELNIQLEPIPANSAQR